MTPLHLYVHIPFCLHKCPYCDFNSHASARPPWDSYHRALLRELDRWARHPAFTGRTLSSVFFGGGTPSLAPQELIAAVLEAADRHWGLDADAEITLEANPGTAERRRFEAYHACGVNRLSLGAQSFDNGELNWLERIHDERDIMRVFQAARKAGFTNINLDLMYGLPRQSIARWRANLERALSLEPEHLSCYQLTLEAPTPLTRRWRTGAFALPDEEKSLAFFEATKLHLAEAGYGHYEISNFSKNGRRCRHNEAYWLYHDYVGIGAGAAGKWNESDAGATRYSNLNSPRGYIRAVSQHGGAVATFDRRSRIQAAAEAAWLGLRRVNGVNIAGFGSRFRVDILALFADALEPWLRDGFLSVHDGHLRLSGRGLALADSIAEAILTWDPKAFSKTA